MIAFIACSGAFILIYYTLLVNEKMFAFNRMYLLFALFLSLIIPFVSFNLTATPEQVHIPNPSKWIEETVVPISTSKTLESTESLNYWIIIYWVVTLLLLIRFLLNLRSVILLINRNERVQSGKTILVLLENEASPSSFLHYIFVNKKDYLDKKVPDEVLYHEKKHSKLKHTLDIIISEIIQIFAWFNPFIWLYKQAIQLNHEFQVDQKVVQHFGSAHQYQYLLISQAANSSKLIHSFNFIHIKKRIIMISKSSNPSILYLKQASTLLFCIIAILVFSEKTTGQNIKSTLEKIPQVKNQTLVLTPSDMEKLDIIAVKALKHSTKGKAYNYTDSEINQMGDLYIKMTKEEKAQQKVTLIPKSKKGNEPKPPTEQEFESFKDPKMYGVWLDGKRIKNSELNAYKHTDFKNWWSSNLAKGATHYGQYKKHLDLHTPLAYKKLQEERSKDKTRYIVFLKNDFHKEINQKIRN